MKHLHLAVAATLFLIISCNQPTHDQAPSGPSEKAMKNLAVDNAINDALQKGNLGALDSLIAADGVDHAGMNGDVVGRDSIKMELGKMRTTFPDMEVKVLKEIADDEYVFQWANFKATSSGSGMGAPPAGTKMDVSSVHVTKFKDGMAIEHWEFMQPADMMKMMPPPAMGAKKDSAAKK